MGALESIAFGSIVRKNWMVAPLDYFDALSKTAHIDGRLSLSFFGEHRFTIDYPKGVIVLETPESLARRQENGVRVTLYTKRQFPRALDAEVDLLVEGDKRQRAIVDTGSAPTKLPLNFFAAMALKSNDPRLQRRTSPPCPARHRPNDPSIVWRLQTIALGYFPSR